MPEAKTIVVDEFSMAASLEEFKRANILRVTVGTNCPRGGDSGHGGRTVLIFEDGGGTDLRCGIDSASAADSKRIELVLGGDSEFETLIEGLEFAAQTLRLLHSANVRSVRDPQQKPVA